MARKRRNGEGSWGRKTINGIKYEYFRDANGKYFYGRTVKDVKKKIKEYSPGQSDSKDVKSQDFGAYITNWLRDIKRPTIKRHTFDGYEDCINGQLLNYKKHDLADRQVGSLTTDDFKSYYSSLSKTYSRGTIKKNYAILSQCIKYGNKHSHFDEKIDLDEISIPHEDVVKKKQREIHFLTKEDMEKLYLESKRVNTDGFNFGGKVGEPTYGNNANIIVFIMFTGLRVGEAIDLRWRDVDLESTPPLIHVNSSNVKLKVRDDSSSKKYEDASTDTKTYSGRRIIPLNQYALEVIESEMKLNPRRRDDDYVFLTKNGGKIQSRQNISRTLNKMMSRANCSIPTCTPHELRHSFGSALLREGTDIKVVSKLLGHKDISVTYNVYIHILDEQKIEAIEGLNNIIGSANKKNAPEQ